jgi:RNase P subunit RPR2
MTPKRLIFDIEVSPNIGWFWKPEYYMRVHHDNIILPGAIICICWKWSGKRKVYALTWDRKHNERRMLKTFIKEMNKADELVTHNGDKFDILWLRTRCLVNNVAMMPDYISIDTYKMAKSGFNFMSNKLSHIAKVCGLGEKLDTGGAKLWKQVLMGETELENKDFWDRLILGNNPAALKKMVRYCKRDVVLLERVWDKMNPYVKSKSHFGGGTNTCPECGSTRLLVNRHRVTAAGSKRVTFQCRNCGKYHSVAESKYRKG